MADDPMIPDANDPTKPAILHKVTETHETTTTTGDAAQSAQVARGARFDDWVRYILSQEIVAGFLFIVIYGQMTGRHPDQDTLMVYVSFVSLSLGFYLGSSYGSNNKDKIAKV